VQLGVGNFRMVCRQRREADLVSLAVQRLRIIQSTLRHHHQNSVCAAVREADLINLALQRLNIIQPALRRPGQDNACSALSLAL
jgi:hypothetical protein